MAADMVSRVKARVAMSGLSDVRRNSRLKMGKQQGPSSSPSELGPIQADTGLEFFEDQGKKQSVDELIKHINSLEQKLLESKEIKKSLTRQLAENSRNLLKNEETIKDIETELEQKKSHKLELLSLDYERAKKTKARLSVVARTELNSNIRAKNTEITKRDDLIKNLHIHIKDFKRKLPKDED